MTSNDKKLLKILLYLIGFVGFYYIVMPLYYGGGNNLLGKESVLSLMAQNKKADSDLKNFALKINNINKLYKDYQGISENTFLSLNSVILSDLDIIRTLYDLDVLIKSSNLLSTSLPKYTINKNLSNPNIMIYTYTIDVSGDYVNFLGFLEKINKSMQVYTVKNIELSQNKDSYNYKIVLDSYELVKNKK